MSNSHQKNSKFTRPYKETVEENHKGKVRYRKRVQQEEDADQQLEEFLNVEQNEDDEQE